MNSINFVASVRIERFRIWEKAKTLLTPLFSLFQRFTLSLADDRVSPSLADRKIVVGGVENVGNSCIFSTLLQDFAAESEFYDALFTTPLQQGDEDNSRFTLRQRLQKHLYTCIKEIRSGALVKKDDIRRLSHLLQQLGWNGYLVSGWRLFLNRIAPFLFPLPLFNPHTLYDMVLGLFAETSDPMHKIVLMAKNRETSLQKLIENSSSFKELQMDVLWKIALDAQEEHILQEQFQLQGREFSLKLVHACLDTPNGKHVLVYRKDNEGWLCCNDSTVTVVKELPSKNIYSVVYTSRLQR